MNLYYSVHWDNLCKCEEKKNAFSNNINQCSPHKCNKCNKCILTEQPELPKYPIQRNDNIRLSLRPLQLHLCHSVHRYV